MEIQIRREASYPVFVHLRIPGVTKTFYYLFGACLLVLALLSLHLLPALHSSTEMKGAYFILTTSEWQRVVFVIGAVGAPTFFILYTLSRYRRRALLVFWEDAIEIDNYKTITSYPLEEITDVAFNDAADSDGFPLAKLTIEFKFKNEKKISVTLIDYSQSEEVLEKLLAYKNLGVHSSTLRFNPEILEE